MRTVMRAIAAMTVGLWLVAAAPPAKDPFLGTWQLDKAKSVIGHDPGVKSKVFVFTRSGAGVAVTETLEMLSGVGGKQVSRLAYVYGRRTPQAGPGFDALLVQRSDRRHAVWTVSLKGKTLSRLRVEVSPDGKQMIFRYLMSAGDPTGAVTHDIYVYDRQ